MLSKWFKRHLKSGKDLNKNEIVFDINNESELKVTFKINKDDLESSIRDYAVVLNALTSGMLDEHIAVNLIHDVGNDVAKLIIDNWLTLKIITKQNIKKLEDAPVIKPSEVFKGASE